MMFDNSLVMGCGVWRSTGMTRFAMVVLVLCSLALSACGSDDDDDVGPRVARENPTPTVQDSARLETGNALFAGRLTAELAREEPTVVLSPFSVSTALAMAYAGAGGETATEMADTLGFGALDARVHSTFNALDRRVSAAQGDGVKLNIANALYVQRGASVQQPFLDTLARQYGSAPRSVDFAGDPSGAVGEVNKWVAGETEDKIEKLLEDVDPATRLVLANAIYLDAKWQSPFERESTRNEPFHAPGGTKDVPTMHKMASFPYGEREGSRTLELPYRGGRLALDVVLPTERDGLPAVMRALERDPQSLVEGLEGEMVQLALPKMELRSALELSKPLQALGMRRAFDPSGADFRGMSTQQPPLFIGQIAHQAYVRIDEEGTEAAAATAVGMAGSAAPTRTLEFKVDRPFAFLLRDRQTGAVLFTGVVSDPS